MTFNAVRYAGHDTKTGEVFQYDTQFWLDLQMDYDLEVAEDKLAGRIDDEVRVYTAV